MIDSSSIRVLREPTVNLLVPRTDGTFEATTPHRIV